MSKPSNIWSLYTMSWLNYLLNSITTVRKKISRGEQKSRSVERKKRVPDEYLDETLAQCIRLCFPLLSSKEGISFIRKVFPSSSRLPDLQTDCQSRLELFWLHTVARSLRRHFIPVFPFISLHAT